MNWLKALGITALLILVILLVMVITALLPFLLTILFIGFVLVLIKVELDTHKKEKDDD